MGMMRAHLFPHALFLVQCLISCSAMALTNITTDESVLLALKSRLTMDPSHLLLKNWSNSTSVCTWIGVTCGSRHQRVAFLDISTMGLIGNLPPEMGNLSFLVALNLSDNSFHGNLPQELAQLQRLKVIDVESNNFVGEMPSWLGFLAELQFLNLRNNSFTGFVPNSIANVSKLETLDLSYNPLNGKVPEEIGSLYNMKMLLLQYNQLNGLIPMVIFNISSLETLAFTGNSLSGDLPLDICRGLPSLKELLLSSNELDGQIPSNISACSQLRALSLSVNNFSGSIPRGIGNLKVLETMYLNSNDLTGSIPRGIGNLTMLHTLDISNNNLTGTIPEEIGNLDNLELLNLGVNSLRGSIPTKIFNISTLRIISVSMNNISGYLPSSFGYGLPNLEELYLHNNHFSGEIPHSISNSSKLTIIEFLRNKFSGPVPNSLGELNFLESLNLIDNNFVSESSELSFITSLKNCRYLRRLGLADNLFNGILPVSVGNLSTSLQYFYAYHCGLQGSIPDEFGNLINLLLLSLFGNQLTGSIPNTLVNLQKLQGLALFQNRISGTIPDSICGLQSLEGLWLDKNQLTGTIPDCIGDLTALRRLRIGNNRLSSQIPTSLWQLNDLLMLNLSSNFLMGSLPLDIGNLKAAILVDLSMNQFSGIIPNSIGGFQNLINLSLAHNRFQYSIPESIGKMVSLEALDLSHNNLSGNIPKSVEGLRYLTYFDVSFNYLSGQIPSGGPFKNFSHEFFTSNEGLCGDPRYDVPPCQNPAVERSKRRKVILPIVYALSGVSALVLALALTYVLVRYQRKAMVENQTDLSAGTAPAPLRASYYELAHATEGFSESHLLGTGGFSSVYKATLQNGEDVAVKVFNLQLEGAFRSFDTECEILRSLRHRNLCKVIGSCSNEEFKALVLEYMPNGTLEKWLYSEDYFLDIIQRISIMIDVAFALEYLHHGYSIPIVHCDLKPSNVLLDEDMVGHLSDFGIAKLLHDGDSFAQTTTFATLGYIAPEYGSEGLVSIRCDVYSYGIMLMEVFTRTKPASEQFAGDLSLRSWINSSLPSEIMQILDSKLLKRDEEYFTEKLECFSSIMELALKCSMESPNERISMKDVVVALKKIRFKLLEYFP